MHNMEKYNQFYLTAGIVFGLNLTDLFPVLLHHAVRAFEHGRQEYFLFVVGQFIDKTHDVQRVEEIVFAAVDKRPQYAADIIDMLISKNMTTFLSRFADKALELSQKQPIIAVDIMNTLLQNRKYFDAAVLQNQVNDFLQKIPIQELAKRGISVIERVEDKYVQLSRRAQTGLGYVKALEMFKEALGLRIKQGKKKLPKKAVALFSPVAQSLRLNTNKEYIQMIADTILQYAENNKVIALVLIDEVIAQYSTLLKEKYKRYRKVAEIFAKKIKPHFSFKAKDIDNLLSKYKPKES